MSLRRLPRNVSGADLVKALGRAFAYEVTRQTGSHIRLTTIERGGHHLTVPAHRELRLGTLASIVAAVASHFGLGQDDVVDRLKL